jgi:hypothetical protein
VEPVDDDGDDEGGDVEVGAVVLVVAGHGVVAVVVLVVVVVVPLVVVVGSQGTVVVVVLDVVGVDVVVVDCGVVVVVVGRVVVVLLPGVAGRVVGVVVAGGDVGLVVVGGLVGRSVVRSPTLPGTAVPAATPPGSGASVETWRSVDDPPAPEPRMLAHANSCEVTERSQFTSRESLPPLNHLRARTKSPQRSVSSRTLGRNPMAMFTAAMSNRSAA